MTVTIIGRTSDGYIITASENDVAQICGFRWSNSDFSRHAKALGAMDDRGNLRTGAKLPVEANFTYIDRLRDRENTVRAGAKVLRELADMIETGLPSVIIPPVVEAGSGGDGNG